MALAPHLAPSMAPATDATVSVSWPIRTAHSSASTRWWQSKLPSPGAWGGTGVWVMADQAACNAVTTKPLSGERGRLAAPRLRRCGGPEGAAVLGEELGARSKVREGAGEDGVPDRQAPQGAGLPGERVSVGEGKTLCAA